MKSIKYSIGIVVGVVILLTSVVLLFPVAFNNQRVYSIILYASIAIVILLLLYLVWINVFATPEHKQNFEFNHRHIERN